MRISDWSSDVCSSDLARWIYNGKCRDAVIVPVVTQIARLTDRVAKPVCIEGADEIVWSRSGQGCGTSAVPTRCVMPKQKGRLQRNRPFSISLLVEPRGIRSEEHTSELQSLMRNSYAVF